MRRRMLASVGGKPLPYDAEVEWLQSSGTQYIEAPITLDGYSEVDIKFFTTKGAAFGSRVGWNNRIYLFLYHANTNDNYLCYGNGYGSYWNATYSDPLRVKYTLGENMVATLLDGAGAILRFQTFNIVDFTTPTRCVLFGYYSGSKVVQSSSKIYFFKANNRTESVDMIPVKFTNENGVSEGAMYDRVSGQLFRNAGTGAFIIGPDKASALVSTRGGDLNA